MTAIAVIGHHGAGAERIAEIIARQVPACRPRVWHPTTTAALPAADAAIVVITTLEGSDEAAAQLFTRTRAAYPRVMIVAPVSRLPADHPGPQTPPQRGSASVLSVDLADPADPAMASMIDAVAQIATTGGAAGSSESGRISASPQLAALLTDRAARPRLSGERADRATYLRTSIARARTDALGYAATQFREVTRSELATADDARRVTRAVDGAIERTHAVLTDYLGAVGRGTFAGVGPAPQLSGSNCTPLPCDPVMRRSSLAEDSVILVLGVSAGVGLGRVAAHLLQFLGPARYLGIPVGVGVAVAVTLLLLRTRKRAIRAAELRTTLREYVTAARQRTELEVVARIVAAEATFSAALTRELDRRRRAEGERVAELDRQIAALTPSP